MLPARRFNGQYGLTDFFNDFFDNRSLEKVGVTSPAINVKENDKGEFKVSLRSVGPDVASVAAKHSGGGHKRAAGCTIEASGIDDAERVILAQIKSCLM